MTTNLVFNLYIGITLLAECKVVFQSTVEHTHSHMEEREGGQHTVRHKEEMGGVIGEGRFWLEKNNVWVVWCVNF